MQKSIKRIVFITSTSMLACLALWIAISFACYYLRSTPTDQTITIAPRTSTRAMLTQLHAQGLVPPLLWMGAPILLTQNYHSFKAGEYEFTAGSSPASILAKIARGEVVIHKITIPEGWNNWQIRTALLNEPLLSGEVPVSLTEGSILPDTVHFTRGEPRAQVVARMQQAQSELLTRLWPTRQAGLPLATPQEALILASIIEKETGIKDEREQVAGVFINRLRLGMKLQTDPTVAYGVEAAQGGAPLGRELSRRDLNTDTPYNTYTRTGLPPTPICHPGRKAIEAALNPATTDALYFVATGTGGHHFASTLAQHEANVKAYRDNRAAALPQP